MKKAITILALSFMLASCNSDREHELKVYNWSTYIDESLIPEFEQWYEEQTGERVKVIYQTFDVLETMLSKIEKGHEDYDVVCPSDYIIERMLQNGLLLPLDRNFGNTPDYTADISPFIKDYFKTIRGGGLDANNYAAGYMWGTTGILYNTKYVTREEAATWEVLRNPKFSGKIFVKDSPRDVCSQIILHVKQKELAEGKVTMDSLMMDSSPGTLAAVEEYMKEVKKHVAGWEADFGKEQMTMERGWINLNWSGDSQWAIEEAAEMGVPLDFVCPKEGFTIFFDGWVIPRYARNVKAANYWINFLCRRDVAARNADEIGYVSVVGGQEMLDAFIDEDFPPIDLSYFFGPGADSVRVNPVIYPDRKDIERSVMEHDWGDDTHLLIELWSRIKGDNAGWFTYLVIGITFTGLIALAIRKFIVRRRKRKRQNRHSRILR